MAYFEDGHGFGKSRSLKKKPNFQTVVQRWATVILLCLSCTPTLEVRGQLEKEVVRAADTVDSVKHMPGGGGGGFTVPGGGGCQSEVWPCLTHATVCSGLINGVSLKTSALESRRQPLTKMTTVDVHC